MANATTTILEGITIEQAGGLLFDCQTTSRERALCRDTYVRALEDFTFAMLFTDRLAVAGSLVGVGSERPGADLVGACGGQFHTIRSSVAHDPRGLLDDPLIRRLVRRDLKVLDQARRQHSSFWKHLVRRELTAYLGDEVGLADPHAEPRSLKFGKNYITDPVLQAQVPLKFVDALAAEARTRVDRFRVTSTALREFVSRVALTHVLVFWWYEGQKFGVAANRGWHIPCPTRAAIREVAPAPSSPGRLLREAKVMVRFALKDILHTCGDGDRGDVLYRIRDFHQQEPYKSTRRLVGDYVAELAGGKSQAVEKSLDALLGDLRRIGGSNPDVVTIEAGIPKVPGVTVGVPVRFGWVRALVSRRVRAIRKWHNFHGPFQGSEYRTELDRVFPELAK